MKHWIAVLLLAGMMSALLAAEQVNVNTATAEEIAQALTGIGPSKAQKIVEYRDKNGPFLHVDELVNVKGIGLRTVDMNREFIILEDKQTSSE